MNSRALLLQLQRVDRRPASIRKEAADFDFNQLLGSLKGGGLKLWRWYNQQSPEMRALLRGALGALAGGTGGAMMGGEGNRFRSGVLGAILGGTGAAALPYGLQLMQTKPTMGERIGGLAGRAILPLGAGAATAYGTRKLMPWREIERAERSLIQDWASGRGVPAGRISRARRMAAGEGALGESARRWLRQKAAPSLKARWGWGGGAPGTTLRHVPRPQGLAYKMPAEILKQLKTQPLRVRAKGVAGLAMPALAAAGTWYAQKKLQEAFGG